ncbi:hypothetical protein AAMO2058_000226500 [Amorphochlora amoebiformis]
MEPQSRQYKTKGFVQCPSSSKIVTTRTKCVTVVEVERRNRFGVESVTEKSSEGSACTLYTRLGNRSFIIVLRLLL